MSSKDPPRPKTAFKRDSVFIKALLRVLDSGFDDRLLIIITHAYIELFVNALVERHCKHGKQITSNHRDYTQSVKLLLLHEKGVLDDYHYYALNWFRDRRNDAAHKHEFSVDLKNCKNVFEEFKRKYRPTMPVKMSGAEDFRQLCIGILVSLLIDHHEVLRSLPPPPTH